MPSLLVYSSGYGKTPWVNDRQEIGFVLHERCGGDAKKHWAPWNKDFETVARNSGGGQPAANVQDLLKVISRQGVESIEELRILGHANDKCFALGGEVKTDDVYFTDNAALIGPDTDFVGLIPQLQQLQDRFTATARIVLMGCNAGSGKKSVLKLVSQAFLRKACGYKEEIRYSFNWHPVGPPVTENRQVVCNRISPISAINVRGRMMYSTQGNLMATVFGDSFNGGMYRTDARELEPDETCNDFDLFAITRRRDLTFAAHELIWRILSTFCEGHAWVSGTGAEEKLVGLKVTKDGGKMCIVGGRWFVQNFTPRTLWKRVNEVKQAVKLVEKGEVGVVPPT